MSDTPAKPRSSWIWMHSIVDGVFLLAAASSLLYFYGFMSLRLYYSRFHLDIMTLNLSPYLIIERGVYGFFYFVPFIGIFAMWRRKPSLFTLRFSVTFLLPLSSFFLIIGLRTTEYPYWSDRRMFVTALVTAALIFGACSLFIQFTPLSVIQRLLQSLDGLEYLLVFLAAIVFFVLSVTFSMYWASVEANDVIEGQHGIVSDISLSSDQTMADLLRGNTVALAYESSDTYYFVQVSNPAPDYPTVFVLPKSQVLGMVIRR